LTGSTVTAITTFAAHQNTQVILTLFHQLIDFRNLGAALGRALATAILVTATA
jgi:hypothetical protein